jgi:hypothetical protein
MRATQLMAVAAALLFSTNLAFAQAQPQQRPTGAAAPPAATAPVSRSAAPAAGQYKTEADAKSHCGSQEVVWLNTASNVYHFHGHKDYGTTKSGAYLCQADADKIGRAAKNEKGPKG